MSEKLKDDYTTSRVLYIIEAALEYFVSIAVGTVYLAKIATYCGISDEVTAILTSFVSLGCGFQLFSLLLGGKVTVKKFVTAGHVFSQILFTALYVIPLVDFSEEAKTVLLLTILLLAQASHNLVNAHKIDWFMSMVKDENRGKFTAVKEMVSLIGGIAFSFALSSILDKCESTENLRTAFVSGAAILFLITVLHTLTLVFSKQPQKVETYETPKRIPLKELLKNKTITKVVIIAVLWMSANYSTISFSGTYMNNELGFSLTFSSVTVLLGSALRLVFSVPFGKLADKKGFCHTLVLCFSIAAAGFSVNIFTSPDNGKILYPVYYALYCIANAGINSAMINVIYDYVERPYRTYALAINQSFSGLAGFLITIVLSPVMSAIKQNGNAVFGLPLYAQQLFSVISLLLTLILIIYLLVVIRKLPRIRTRIYQSDL